MGNIILIFLIVVGVKFIFFTVLLFTVFRNDISQMWRKKNSPDVPPCVYCKSKWTVPVGEDEMRWDQDGLALVTTYTCQHCQLPFWHVERVPVPAMKR